MVNRQVFWGGCLILIVSLAKSGLVYADRVSGKVSPVPDDGSFTIKDSTGREVKTVKVSKSGYFQVFLHPGLYNAESSDGSATIRSESVPLTNQTIEFQN